MVEETRESDHLRIICVAAVEINFRLCLTNRGSCDKIDLVNTPPTDKRLNQLLPFWRCLQWMLFVVLPNTVMISSDRGWGEAKFTEIKMDRKFADFLIEEYEDGTDLLTILEKAWKDGYDEGLNWDEDMDDDDAEFDEELTDDEIWDEDEDDDL